MLTDQYIPLLPGMEQYHIGMRQCECECGCGQVFYQPQIGRVRKYLNAKHKAQAYRNREKAARRKAEKTISQRLGEMFDQVSNPLYWPETLTDAQEAFISEATHNPLSVLATIRLIREMEQE